MDGTGIATTSTLDLGRGWSWRCLAAHGPDYHGVLYDGRDTPVAGAMPMEDAEALDRALRAGAAVEAVARPGERALGRGYGLRGCDLTDPAGRVVAGGITARDADALARRLSA